MRGSVWKVKHANHWAYEIRDEHCRVVTYCQTDTWRLAMALLELEFKEIHRHADKESFCECYR